MNLLRAISVLALTSCLAPWTLGQKESPGREPAVLVRCTPETVSVGTVVDLEGYRLGANDPFKVQVFFVQGGTRRQATRTNSSYHANSAETELQHLWVDVPDGLTLGTCQVVVEIRSERSASIPIEIVRWRPPTLTEIRPAWAKDGQSVSIYGTAFNKSEVVELIDAQGDTHRLETQPHATSTSFTLPDGLSAGEATIRIVNPSASDYERSNGLTLHISRGPLPLDLWSDCMEPAAPGQWIYLDATTLKPLEEADRAEAGFSQRGRLLTTPIVGRESALVRIPLALEPGEVELMTRTWRGDKSSDWSKPVTYKVLEKPAPPSVEAIEVGDGDASVSLYPGPDRPESFRARAGDSLTLVGSFHVASGGSIEVTLESAAGMVKLKPTLLADRSAIRIELPAGLAPGAWRISLRTLEDGVSSTVPIVMFLEPGAGQIDKQVQPVNSRSSR